jgi:hypothetical protein
MEENYDSLMEGHLGLKRTYVKLIQDYYWSRMYKDIRAWILDCDHYTTKKLISNKKMGFMRSKSSIRPFQVVGTDILGPLLTSKEENRYILTFMDILLNRWKNMQSEAIAKVIAQYFVWNIVFRYKCPEKLLLDRKKAFIGELMMEITWKLEIHAIKTSAFHLQTNG